MNTVGLSVVMPNFNHARFLPRSIESIVNQTRRPDEFLILDDASTDDSVEVIERYVDQYPFIRLIRLAQNQGVNRANQILFEQATGQYIHPMAADDDRFLTFFERAMDMAEAYPAAGIVFGQVVVKNADDDQIGFVDVQQWKEPTFADPQRYLDEYLNSELASHSASTSTIYRTDPFREVGWYRTDLGPWADTFAARAIGLRHGACYVPEEFSVAYMLDDSFSHKTRSRPKSAIDLIARSAYVMRSARFRDRFPESHVRRWEREYKKLVAWNHLLAGSKGPRRSFVVRNLQRLPRIPSSMSLLVYRGNPTYKDPPLEKDSLDGSGTLANSSYTSGEPED